LSGEGAGLGLRGGDRRFHHPPRVAQAVADEGVLCAQETRETHKWRTEVDKEHREATEQLADTALERYTSNNAMLAELFDGRPYQPPPGEPSL
jgi:hypothetical protein